MTPEEKLRGIESWRGMEMLTPFFGISCACEGLEETTFGEIVDFLLSSLREKEREVELLRSHAKGSWRRGCEYAEKTWPDQMKAAMKALADEKEARRADNAALTEETLRLESQLSALIERAAQVAEEKARKIREANTFRHRISSQAITAAAWCDDIAAAIRNLAEIGKEE